jgi:hypothetical protein
LTQIPTKTVGGRTYVHVDALPLLDADTAERVRQAERLAGVERLTDFNLVRLDDTGPAVALLNYPDFADDPFPALRESRLVDLDAGTLSYRTYADSLNPPILHRKELFLPPEHPRRAEYSALTAACESVGLFDDPRRIGYRRQWLALIRERGYRLDGHALLPLGNDDPDATPADTEETSAKLQPGWQAARHLTALTRYGFSAPIQSLARHGFLDGRYRLFDYGCGRGDDVRGLIENGLDAAGWDPYHAPDRPIQAADIVNLGFVINVIEDFDERLEALTRAWSLAERLLVVSVMLANQNDPRGTRFRDGVMTQRGTFQKYFTQSEIKAFLDQVLDEEAIAVAPGVLYVFRDKDAEQRFLVDRYRRRRQPLRAPTPRPRVPSEREPRARTRPGRRTRGRLARTARTPVDTVAQSGTPARKVRGRRRSARPDRRLQLPGQGVALPRIAPRPRRTRTGRTRPTRRSAGLSGPATVRAPPPYRHLERGLQQDIKHFFGDYAAARAEAAEWLFRIADIGAIEDACRTAAEQGLGWLDPGRSLQLHASLVERLPPLLRLYVGAAAVLYGDCQYADLIKIHIASGKVSLMRYDDFEGQALPRLVERVKIRLRDLDIDYFAYGEDYEPPFLYRKSRYINEEFERYPEQLAFDQALDDLQLFDLDGYGPPPGQFLETLARRRRTVEGFELIRPRTPPALDDPCGRFLTFRQLIECGETQAQTGLANLPRRPESYDALLELAEQVLDPVIEYFGMIRLTYGFCSPELARRIPGRIDPKRDQHAAHELNRLGRPVCERLGAAADFIVEDESMLEVAQWIVANTPFDRLYVYGDDQPIHVSHGPNRDRQIVRMTASPSGRLVPRVVPAPTFLASSGPSDPQR